MHAAITMITMITFGHAGILTGALLTFRVHESVPCSIGGLEVIKVIVVIGDRVLSAGHRTKCRGACCP